MKKTIYLLMMIMLLAFLGGCRRDTGNTGDPSATAAPTTKPLVTLPAKEVTDEDNSDTTAADNMAEETVAIQDYYPIQADTEYVYQGEGSEYASFNRYTDYLDADSNKVQTRTNNGGTETVKVIQVKDGRVSVIYSVNECYYRENFLNKETKPEDAEVLLKEPLVKGTEWKLPDGRKRYISGTEVEVDTPSGKYTAIEVTTEENSSKSMDYYAPKVGLVKSVYGSGDMEVASTLSKINTNSPFTQNISIFYPASDEKIYVEPLTLTFRTGDDTKLILEEALHQEAAKDTYLPLASSNTKINELYLDKDNIVHVDFSEELVKDMNAGAGYEVLILQSITNTLGNYYGVNQVIITMDGKPYESGHILMKEGETFKVDLDQVVW